MEARVVIDRKSEAGIFSRVVDHSLSNFYLETTRSILNLGFNAEDYARVHELTTRNQVGALSAEEKEELMNYVKVGNVLARLQSRARKVLKHHPRNYRNDRRRVPPHE